MSEQLRMHIFRRWIRKPLRDINLELFYVHYNKSLPYEIFMDFFPGYYSSGRDCAQEYGTYTS